MNPENIWKYSSFLPRLRLKALASPWLMKLKSIGIEINGDKARKVRVMRIKEFMAKLSRKYFILEINNKARRKKTARVPITKWVKNKKIRLMVRLIL